MFVILNLIQDNKQRRCVIPERSDQRYNKFGMTILLISNQRFKLRDDILVQPLFERHDQVRQLIG